MNRVGLMLVLPVTFGAGLLCGAMAAVGKVDASYWLDREPAEAARELLEAAEIEAGRGSWERIGVGRVHYLAGRKEKGQSIFDQYLHGDTGETSDLLRIARIYVEAGEWEKAEPVLRELVERAPKKGGWLIEAGSYYNLHGDRERAEELFRQGFAGKGGDLWATLKAAASYEGVQPQIW